MDIFTVLKQNNPYRLKDILSAGADVNAIGEAGAPLHIAVSSGGLEVLEVLLKQFNVKIDIQNNDGDTPLHLAVQASDVEAAKILLSFGANPNVSNGHGKVPLDYAKDAEIKALLAERMVAAATGNNTRNAKNEMIRQLEAELPNDVPTLKNFTIEVVMANQLFQDRCKETIHQLIEEKHIALHKYRLLENAAGIGDKETGVNFLSQLQYLQLENEQQAATIAYLKIQNRMLETSVTQQEEYYRKNLSEVADQHNQEINIMMERVKETEAKFLEVQKQISEEVAHLRNENQDMRAKYQVKSPSTPGGIASQDEKGLQNVMNENNQLNQKLKEILAEKVAIAERLKSTEQLKALYEQENLKVRNDMNLLRKTMQEAMSKVLTEARTETDEKDENSGQIVFIRGQNGSKQIKGATPDKLVERLTDPTTYDSQFQAAFLLTFRSFMDCNTFLLQMIKRYKDNIIVEPSPSISTVQSPQSPIQLRVCNTLKNWIENYWFDFQDDKALLDKLIDFVEFVSKHNVKLVSVIKAPLTRKMAGQDAPAHEKKNFQPRPKPILPKALAKRSSGLDVQEKSANNLNSLKNDRPSSIGNWGGFNFTKLRINEEKGDDYRIKLADLEPLEIARQLTLIEYELFTAIKPTEFLDQAWMKDDKEQRAPNICNMTRWSNHVIHWVISEIVAIKESAKARALLFERLIMVAQHLEKLNNFNGVKEILAGLQGSAVYRLKRTKEAVGNKHLKIMDELIKLISSDLNFKNLRAKIYAADPPLIPFPGVYQGDLVFLDTCSKSKLENGLVNFSKYQKIASYILELQVYQQTPYHLEPVMEIGDYIKHYQTLDDDQAYNDSLICEPRGT